LYTGGFLACVLATFSLIGYTFYCLFGRKIFFLGLGVACIAGSGLSYLVTYGYLPTPTYNMLLWIMFPLTALFAVIGRRRSWELIIFQVACYAMGLIAFLFPIKMVALLPTEPMGFPVPKIAVGTLPALAIPVIFLLIFSIAFTKKAYQLYARPRD